MKGSIYRIIQAIFFLFIITIVALPYFSTTTYSDEKTIKVGKYDVPGLVDSDDVRSYSGYASEYMQEVTKYIGCDYEFVDDSWDNLLKMLANGEIDMICTAQYSEQRDAIYDYSDEPLGYENSKLYTRTNNNQFYFDDFTAFDGMTVAAIKDDLANSAFETYAEENNFSFTYKYYATGTECFEALDAGSVDAVFNAGMKEWTGYKIIAEVSSAPFYIIVKEGNSQLLSKVNQAMTKIRISDSHFEKELYEKYFENSEISKVPSFTREEAEYIASVGTITVGNQVDRFPWCAVDGDGRLYGIQIDLLQIVSQLSGLKFVNEAVPNTVRAVDYMNEAGVRIFNGLSKSEFATFSPDIILSDPIFTDTITFVAVKGSDLHTDDAVRIAIPNAFINGEKLLNIIYPNATVIFSGTKQNCLDSLLKGSADFALLDTYMTSALLQKPRYETLTMLASTGIRQDIDMAVLKSENPLLLSIINKCLDSIGENEKTNIVTKYTVASPYRLSFSDYIYKYRPWLIWIVVLTICLIIMLIITLTLRIKSAAKIKKANDELNIANADLVNSNRNLLEATQQANRANNAKGDFLARMSHDMRTPMNAILGLTALSLDEAEVSPVIKENLSNIRNSGEFLLGLVNDVLDMSKIEHGDIELHYEPYFYSDFLANIKSMFAPLCEQNGLKLEFEDVTTALSIVTDKVRMNQIFFNIFSNAVKYTPEGGIIKYYTKNLVIKDNMGSADYIIEDSGIGMSEEFQKQMFEPFTQESSEITANLQGTGLGLSISKHLVELMGGTMRIESKKNIGTKVIIHLSFEIVPTQQDDTIDDNAIDVKSILKGRHILLVEDHPLNAAIAEKMLSKVGARVDTASNGKIAVDKFEYSYVGDYDAILMDVRMPVMDGLEATRIIRAMKREDAKTIPIIAMTANAYASDVQNCLNAGMNSHLAKPVDANTMYREISKLIIRK